MFDIQYNARDMRALKKSLKGSKKLIRRELAIAVRATAKKAGTIINQNVRTELNAPSKAIKELIKQSVTTTGAFPTATVKLKRSSRLAVKAFRARQTKKGVTYKISKRKSRSLAAGGFMGPKPGVSAVKLRGHAFKRLGKSRWPIAILHGPSPWGVFVKKRMKRPTNLETLVELRNQIKRRINFNTLKRAGKI
jgi:hypothetical protein